MADRLKEDLSYNVTSSFNSNETQMYMQGISLEENALDKDVKQVLGQIETLKHNLLQEKYANAMLAVDCEVLGKLKTHEAHDELLQLLQDEKQAADQLKQERGHIALERERAVLEAIRTTNPKVYSLKKKLVSLQELCQDKKFQLERGEEERNQVSSQYANLINSLKNEEGLKTKIQTLERLIEAKDAQLQDQKSTYSRLQTELEDCDVDMQTRKDLNKLLETHQQLNATLAQTRKDVSGLRSRLDEIEASLHHVQPVSGNSEQIRDELRHLERTITERSKELDVKEKKLKELRVAKAKAEAELKVCRATCVPKEEFKAAAKPKPTTVMINTPNSGLASYRVSLSPKQMEMSKSPGARSRRSRATAASRGKRSKLTEEQQTALKTMMQVEKSKAPAEVVNALEAYGPTEQRLTAKVIQLNRCMHNKPAS